MTNPAAKPQKSNPCESSKGKHANATHRRASKEWLARHRAALEAYNEHVRKHGVFSDGLRSF